MTGSLFRDSISIVLDPILSSEHNIYEARDNVCIHFCMAGCDLEICPGCSNDCTGPLKTSMASGLMTFSI